MRDIRLSWQDNCRWVDTIFTSWDMNIWWSLIQTIHVSLIKAYILNIEHSLLSRKPNALDIRSHITHKITNRCTDTHLVWCSLSLHWNMNIHIASIDTQVGKIQQRNQNIKTGSHMQQRNHPLKLGIIPNWQSGGGMINQVCSSFKCIWPQEFQQTSIYKKRPGLANNHSTRPFWCSILLQGIANRYLNRYSAWTAELTKIMAKSILIIKMKTQHVHLPVNIHESDIIFNSVQQFYLTIENISHVKTDSIIREMSTISILIICC